MAHTELKATALGAGGTCHGEASYLPSTSSSFLDRTCSS